MTENWSYIHIKVYTGIVYSTTVDTYYILYSKIQDRQTYITSVCGISHILHRRLLSTYILGCVATSFVAVACAMIKPSLFAYWLWSCVVTVLILLTKYWQPLVVTLLNYFLQTRSIPSACRTCLHGWSKHFTSCYDPSTPFTTPPYPYHPPPHYILSPPCHLL